MQFNTVALLRKELMRLQANNASTTTAYMKTKSNISFKHIDEQSKFYDNLIKEYRDAINLLENGNGKKKSQAPVREPDSSMVLSQSLQ